VFELIQIIYWLGLSTWFGAALFIAMAAPVIMRTVREANPVLPDILSVNLQGQHGILLGGSIVGRIMTVLFPIELGCAGAMLIAIIGQWVLLRPGGGFLVTPLVRAALYIAAVSLLIYHWRVLWPRVWHFRQEYIDHADEPDVANPALEQLDRLQGESLTMQFFLVTLLLGMIVFSANISPVQRILIPAP
jgi:hypothetical protein